jgi:hemoglobin-like flavoprotein
LEQIKIVKSTIPTLEQHGIVITTLFYKRLLDSHPELKNIFNMTHQIPGEQRAALAHAVSAYASNIDNLAAFQTTISRIGHKHASLGITPEQYPMVGEGLLAAIKRVLGDAANELIIDAGGWRTTSLPNTLFNLRASCTSKQPPHQEAGEDGASFFCFRQSSRERRNHLLPFDSSG